VDRSAVEAVSAARALEEVGGVHAMQRRRRAIVERDRELPRRGRSRCRSGVETHELDAHRRRERQILLDDADRLRGVVGVARRATEQRLGKQHGERAARQAPISPVFRWIRRAASCRSACVHCSRPVFVQHCFLHHQEGPHRPATGVSSITPTHRPMPRHLVTRDVGILSTSIYAISTHRRRDVTQFVIVFACAELNVTRVTRVG
jgi:hypothetical protein